MLSVMFPFLFLFAMKLAQLRNWYTDDGKFAFVFPVKILNLIIGIELVLFCLPGNFPSNLRDFDEISE